MAEQIVFGQPSDNNDIPFSELKANNIPWPVISDEQAKEMELHSRAWWDLIKNDKNRLMDWLKNQYKSEAEASIKLQYCLLTFKDIPDSCIDPLQHICFEELNHALWIRQLIESRGDQVEDIDFIDYRESRYWGNINFPKNWRELTAISAFAEDMRLYRIKTIYKDPTTPLDIHKVFSKILKDEAGHEAFFRGEALKKDMIAAFPFHKKGMEALGFRI